MEPDPDPNRKNRVIAVAFLAETPEQAIELEQIVSEMPEVPRQIGDQDVDLIRQCGTAAAIAGLSKLR